MDWDYGLPIEMTNSTQCLFIDISGTGTIEFTDCLLKYPFVCGKGKGKFKIKFLVSLIYF